MANEAPQSPSVGVGDVLTVGFGVSICMWTVGYLCRLPVGVGPDARPLASGAVLLALLALCLVIGGFLGGRWTTRGVWAGVGVGLVSGLVNLLVIAGMLHGDPQSTLLNALVWIPGALVVSIVLASLGAVVGARSPHPPRTPDVWLGRFAVLGALATLALIAIGGVVTGFDEGLAVVDWPNTEGYMMFLYPLSKMTGGIYYEHAHRLIGSLVGLTTLVLAVYVQLSKVDVLLKRIVWIALAMVAVQGVLGGLRVTGTFTLSTNPNDTSPSLALAVGHGVFGQLFYSLMVVTAAFASLAWRTPSPARESPAAATDRTLAKTLYVMLLAQLVLGALVRHVLSTEHTTLASTLLIAHITAAVAVALVGLLVGLRAWGLYAETPRISRLGTMLMAALGVQIILGVAAYIAVAGEAGQPGTSSGLDVLITTGHQTVGAVLLGLAALLAVWNYRLVRPVPAADNELRSPACS